MRLSMVEVARLTGGAVLGDGGSTITGASIDSRSLTKGDLFIALPGEFFDGHDYVFEAIRKEAGGLLLRHEIPGVEAPRVIVSDPSDALTALARHNRDVVDPVVVGITGSVGKTGTKDMIAAVVSQAFNTVASQKNFNNELGVPLTLLKAKTQTEVLVCEMGARGPGQIAELCQLARPQVGVVTNVGLSHFELFGSQEGIAMAKSELVRYLDEGNTAILNADDPLVLAMSELTEANVRTFGVDGEAWLKAEAIRFDRLGRPTFRISDSSQAAWVTLAQTGRHQVYNALAAAAVGLTLGLSLEGCAKGLEDAAVSPMRMEVSELAGIIFIDDSYNASPASMSAALHSAAEMVPAGGRLVAVLGYMAELGDIQVQEHRRVGALAASLASRLIVVGQQAAPLAAGASEAGMTDVLQVDGREEVAPALDLRPGDVLLVKGSRVAQLETVVDDAKKAVTAT